MILGIIITELPNSLPYSIQSGMATKIQGGSLEEPTEQAANDFCYCKYECEYVEKVFAHISDTDYWKNDKNVFLYRKLIPADTVTIKLFKDGVEVATIIDNTYGTYINGYPAPATAEQQLYVAFIIDWQLVLQAFGGGEYQICTELNILGNTTNQDSHKYRLCHYSDLAANGTVRIETYQNGNILASPFDFTGLNFYNSYRVPGRFTETAGEIQSDRYLNRDYKLNQIQDILIPKYLLKTKRVDRSTGLMLTRDTVLANVVQITDYSIINIDLFRRIEVYAESIEQPDIGKTTRAAYEIPFTDKFENIRKRNN